MTDWRLTGLAPGTYTWNVRGVDAAFRGGPAAQGTFTIGPVTPPAVSDGRHGSPVRVAKLDPSGSSLGALVGYDDLLRGRRIPPRLGLPLAAPVDSGRDDLGRWKRLRNRLPVDVDGFPRSVSDPGRLLWFLVIADDGANTEGSWGTDGRGVERMGPAAGGASGTCGMTAKSIANSCGQ